jgi:multimeric flavodoxin WrbA
MATRKPRVVKGSPSVQLNKNEFVLRFHQRHADPAFGDVAASLDEVAEAAWDGYIQYRKNAHKRPAGKGFAKPSFGLSVDWLNAHKRIQEAERVQKRKTGPSRILVINGSARSSQTCPGEMSKSYRLAQIAKRVIEAAPRFEVDFLDLSNLTSEYGRVIYPCKSCVSTAQPLCHWPCSCYPNDAMGQTQDWMNDIYPRWAAAHGVMIVTPVNWYHVPSVLKLMIDRLVCADGGNADPTTTHDKNPAMAKAIELKGWDYPKHLAGRAYAVAVHGDAEGVDNVKYALCDWLNTLGLIRAGESGALARYIGYYEPYATSHDALDRDAALQEEVRNAARSLVETVRQIRRGKLRPPDANLSAPREK